MSRRLTLVQINDFHGYLVPHNEVYWGPHGLEFRTAGGYARIARLLDDIRAERPGSVMFMDGGHTLHGTNPVVRSKAEIMPPILNRLGFDAMTAHWEFAYGPEVFEQLAKELSCPVLASNVYRKDSGERSFQPTMVKEVGGLRVGVVGVASHFVMTMGWISLSCSRTLAFRSICRSRRTLPASTSCSARTRTTALPARRRLAKRS